MFAAMTDHRSMASESDDIEPLARAEDRRRVGSGVTAGSVLAAGAALTAAVILAVAPSFTWPAVVTVLAVGAGVAWAGLARPSTPDQGPVTWAQALPWVRLGLFLCVWELWNFTAGNNDHYPTLSSLLDPVLADPLGRLAFAIVWMSSGAWLLRRVSLIWARTSGSASPSSDYSGGEADA
jgi:hypothetical protein